MAVAHKDIAIRVDKVSKTFKLPHEKHNSIKSAIINFYRRNKSYELQHALKNASFDVRKGEFYGIVGRNGSGKSTLLKMLAGIYAPTKGHIQVNGVLTPFIELGVGFSPELTGRENVFLNGALLGFDRKDMHNMYTEIVKFAELEKFMDQKLKNYSSGMQVRLAFSIAIRANSDILLIDEVLAVGDAAFQAKCFEYFEFLKREKRTIVFVSHDMSAVRRFCTRALLIEKGKIKAIGTPDEIASQYTLDSIDHIDAGSKEENLNVNKNRNLSSEVKTLIVASRSPMKLRSEDTLSFEVSYGLSKRLDVNLGFSIVSNGFSVAEQNTRAIDLPSKPHGQHRVLCEVPLENFNPGVYTLDVAIFAKQSFKLIGYEVGAVQFMVNGIDKERGGPMKTQGVWKVHE